MLKLRNVLILMIVAFFPLAGEAQPSLLNEYIDASGGSVADASTPIATHVSALKKAHHRQSDVKFLRQLFRKTQQSFLKSYQPYVPFTSLFSSREYDCLTATALYAILLDEFDYDFDIIETNYHIFIMVRTTAGEVLLETTDKYRGFVTSREEISERIGNYKRNLVASVADGKSYYDFPFVLYKKVAPGQITGLMHFNQAVNAFNKKEWATCADELERSYRKYESPRVKELAVLLMQTILSSDADASLKSSIIDRFKMFWMERQPLVAIH